MKRLIWPVIFFAIFLARFQNSLQASRNLDSLAGKTILVSGKISSQITLQGNSQSFNLGRIRVTTKLYPRFEYGDKVTVSGILQRRVINRFYSRFSLMYPDIVKAKSGNNLFIGLKKAIETYFDRFLPEPEAALLAGIVLGSKRGLPQDFWENLQKTGTLHIVVASGYNVSVVIGALIFLLAGVLPRPLAIGLGIAAVVIYSFMAGLEPAIIRAAIMGSLAYFAQILGRPGSALRLLFLAAGLMLLVKPLFLFDLGFQLSFLATLGLILISPRLPSRLPSGMKETIAAQIMVWPVLLVNFGQVSGIGILVNSLIVLLVPLAMALSPVPVLAYVPLHLIVVIINWFA